MSSTTVLLADSSGGWEALATLAVVVAVLLLLVIVIMIVGRRWTRGQPEPRQPSANPIVIGPVALQEQFERLRGLSQLQEIRATWSADYGPSRVEEYFQGEQAWLETHPRVRVRRILSLLTLDESLRSRMEILERQCGNLTMAHSTHYLQIELFLCSYLRNSTEMHRAIIVIPNAISQQPEIGVLLDEFQSPSLSAVLHGLRTWFDSMFDHLHSDAAEELAPWDRSAHDYDRIVNEQTQIQFLHEYMRQENQELARVLSTDATRERIVLDFGCGTGRTLYHVLDRSELCHQVKYLIGIDTSDSMLERARQKRARNRPGAPPAFFLRLDGTRAHNVFRDGSYLPNEEFSDPSAADTLNVPTFKDSSKIVISSLNTLGVISETERPAFISAMLGICSSEADLVLLGVFAAEAFDDFAVGLYGALDAITGVTNLPTAAFNSAEREFNVPGYYSKWFTTEEIDNLVRDAGGRIVDRNDLLLEGRIIGYFIKCQRIEGILS